MMNSGGIGVPLGFPLGPTSVIQVTNLSSAVTSEQMRTLFGFLGDIEELRLYPPEPPHQKEEVMETLTRRGVLLDLVLTNEEGLVGVVRLVRLVESLPAMPERKIPGRHTPNSDGPSALLLLGNGRGPTRWRGMETGPCLALQTTTADQLLEFFKQVGEVKFVRMAGDETQPTRFAFVEFADQNSVPRALAFNGVMFGDRPLKINHSNNAIVKPPEMTPQAAAKELEEVMKRVREAQSFISAAIEPESGKSSERKGGRSRSNSRSESRSSSKSRSRRKRSHSKHRSRSGNRSISRHKDRCKSRSPLKKWSRSRERQKSSSRSRSRENKRDKEKVKEKEKTKEKEKERDGERNKDQESVGDKYKDKDRDRDKEREKEKDKEKEKDREEVHQNKEKEDIDEGGVKDREKVKDKERDKDKEKDRDKKKEKDGDKLKEQQRGRDDKRKKEKRSRTPPRSYSSSRRSRSSSRFV
ncbi:splicing regulatory glutamine/lysine-rich protein 1-like [Oxyura jamaicensis]|uniref:splicing regulatory glutamine/lysine-rich protein 1-like n=1 Tax=Oxyura jamaicensis TaxID=8884 RepID=UPI0015A7230B|nr:splicing regulatory glutamine/lysine-rich protein 1-like [Oxyura jamaicensis]